MENEKKIIGRTDKVDFSLLGIININAKIDTGAYTSSIHCKEITEINNDTLECVFLDPTHPEYNGKKITFKNYTITTVKSSNGVSENRYTIQTKIVVFNKKYTITINLSSRDDMKFPVLIGRKFLRGKFLVDPQIENQSFNLKPNEYQDIIA